MSLAAVLLPLFVEVVLTFGLMLGMGALRNNDYRSGAVKPQEIALREPKWPARTAQVANSFSNQFELPVLFYVLTILEWVTRHAGVLFDRSVQAPQLADIGQNGSHLLYVLQVRMVITGVGTLPT